MIIEDFVSFETAKLLMEKGFNGECYWYYTLEADDNVDAKTIVEPSFEELSYNKENYLIAPTLQMAMKWLRKEHNLCLFVIPATIDKTFRTGYALYPQCDSKWEWCASKNDRSKATFGFNINRKYCDSHEEACEAALQYCLENLI